MTGIRARDIIIWDNCGTLAVLFALGYKGPKLSVITAITIAKRVDTASKDGIKRVSSHGGPTPWDQRNYVLLYGCRQSHTILTHSTCNIVVIASLLNTADKG